MREKIIEYFTVMKDDGLKNYAVSVLEDPYDEKKSTVNLVFRYAGEIKLKEAAEPVMVLLENENEDFLEPAITALGKIGGAEEAVFLAEYLERDLPLNIQQALVRTLGELQAVETWDKLADIARDSDENGFMRMYAAEAIGNMKKPESVPVLVSLFEESEPNRPTYLVRGLSNYDTTEAKAVILEAFKDNYYKVRMEAADAAERLSMKESVPFLVYRAKNDPENTVKYKCYEVLGALNTKDGNDFLLSVVNDPKKNDTARAKAVSVLLEDNFDAGIDDILRLAQEALKDDKLKNLRYAIGKELTKYQDPRLAGICGEFMAHKDVATKGIGLDIYAKNKFPSQTEAVRSFAENEKMGAIQKKAAGILAD